ncbi:MAG: EamA family transporter [Acidimicrobiales bacterium]
MAIIVGLLVAAGFGSGDFLGGLASRESNTMTVLAVAQLSALVGATAVALVAGGPLTGSVILLGIAAGALNVTALGCLYQGLAIGQIGEVAPVAAVVGAVIPVAWGLAIGERPPALALAGAALAVVAGGLITLEQDEQLGVRVGRALLLALAAGVGFGTSFIFFADASHHSGFWPVLTARLAAVVGVGIVVVASRAPRSLPPRSRGRAIGAGALDVLATALLLVAVRLGLVAVVAPVASLAPAFTVLGAWWYLRERASRVQVGGLVLALIGLVLIAAS